VTGGVLSVYLSFSSNIHFIPISLFGGGFKQSAHREEEEERRMVRKWEEGRRVQKRQVVL
jgi:hypothetical protein